MQDLIETTHTTHYAQYRSSRIRAKGRPESFLACDEYYDSSKYLYIYFNKIYF